MNFAKKYDLFHRCSKKSCLSDKSQLCREGYPKDLTQGFAFTQHPIAIEIRRKCIEEQRIIPFERTTIKFFNSNCQFQTILKEQHLSYICKYQTKLPPKVNLDLVIQEERQEKVIEEEDNQKHLNLLKNYFDLKQTPLQEAYFAFQELPTIDKKFQVIKIKQQPLLLEKKMKILQKADNQTNLDTFFGSNQIQSVWLDYLSRPNQFEYLNLVEYYKVVIVYRKKAKYLKKIQEQEEKQDSIQPEQILYFIDFNGKVIKLREKEDELSVVFQTSYLFVNKDFQGSENLYYLQMLQLYYPHRKNSWISTTQDSFEGFKTAYEQLINSFDYPKETTENYFETYIRKKCAKFASFPLKNYVEEYIDLKPWQKRFLQSLFLFKSGLSHVNEDLELIKERKQQIRIDYMLELFEIVRSQIQQTDIVVKELLTELIPILNPILDKNEEMLEKFNLLSITLFDVVEKQWKAINKNSQQIILNLALIYKHYGITQLLNLIPIEKKLCSNKLIPSKSNESLQLSLMSQLENPFTEFSAHYKKVLTQSEMEQNNFSKEIIFFTLIGDCILFHLWENLNFQQRLVVIANLICLQHINQKDKINKGIFIHGPGGVGKSFILMFLIQFSHQMSIKYSVLCPTQQSVQNIYLMCRKWQVKEPNVQTIHSFLQFQKNDTITSLWIKLQQYLLIKGIKSWVTTAEIFEDVLHYKFKNFQSLASLLRRVNFLIFEEVSMIDPLFFSLLDIYCQIARICSLPFGGIVILLLGDSFQLCAVSEKNNSNYFHSHIFTNNYFLHMFELNQPIRQKEDLQYFQEILQPIRLGKFHFNSEKFQEKINELKKRALPFEFGQDKQRFSRLQFELDKKQQLQNEQVVYLFFKNKKAQCENLKQAKLIVNQIMEKKQKNYSKWRIKHFQPLQFSFSNNSHNLQKLLLFMGQDYQINLIEREEINYQGHFSLLPIGIRNQLAKQCSTICFQYIEKEKLSKQKSNCLMEDILIFENAEIVIRSNINKNSSLINGQFANIQKLIFDLDETTLEELQELKNQEMKFIQDNNVIFENLSKHDFQYFSFKTNQLNELNLLFEEHNLNNINSLFECDISKSEKLKLYQTKMVAPRLAKILIKIPHLETPQILDLTHPSFTSEYVVPSDIFKNSITRLIEQVEQGIELLKIVSRKPFQRQKDEMYSQLRKEQLFEIFYVDIISNNFSQDLLIQAKVNLLEMKRKMDQNISVLLHQLPINLGYARTIHSAQGSTFQNAVIDLDLNCSSQSHGLLYTALSRVQKMNDLYFLGKFCEDVFKVRVSEEIIQFYQNNFLEVQAYINCEQFNLNLNNSLEQIIQMLNTQSEEVYDQLQKCRNILNHNKIAEIDKVLD